METSHTATVEATTAPEPVAPARGARPSREELLACFGDADLSLQALFRFCFLPAGRLTHLRELAHEEEWGENHFALLRYLAVHVQLAIEQGCYEWNGDQLITSAGRLTTGAETPIFLGFIPNASPQQDNPWVLNWVGERPSCGMLPDPPALGEWPLLDPGAEVLIGFDLADDERRGTLGPLERVAPSLRTMTVIGAVHWALQRGLVVRQAHAGGRGYFVPLFLESRDDLTESPDLVAPLSTRGRRAVVRALLEPQAAYAAARAVVDRAEVLPEWLAAAWDEAVEARNERD
ncbi:MAG: hypothetical protein AAFZ65_13360 [Planctomycetota bacterium]